MAVAALLHLIGLSAQSHIQLKQLQPVFAQQFEVEPVFFGFVRQDRAGFGYLLLSDVG